MEENGSEEQSTFGMPLTAFMLSASQKAPPFGGCRVPQEPM